MTKQVRIGLLHKKRGNFALQEMFAGPRKVVDTTSDEVAHHREALTEAGYAVTTIYWGPDFLRDLQASTVGLFFNVSSMAEAAILEELRLPYVGSSTPTIALATDKSLAKRLWQEAGLPTSPFRVACGEEDCADFRDQAPFSYPLFIKPVAGRGSAGIDATSVVHNYDELVAGVSRRYNSIGQPVLIERYLQGREITIGIVGNGRNARVLPLLEIVYRTGDLALSFDKKEADDDLFFCPARLTDAEREEITGLALRAYHTLGFCDFGRIDTKLTDQGAFLLEGNTFAGLTCTPAEKPHSYMGFMARAEGKGGKELLDEIVRAAIARLDAGQREDGC